MVDEPQSKNPYDIEGGYVAAPAFKSIAQGILQVLQVKPDRPGTALTTPPSRLQPPWSSPRCARTRASPRV